MLFDRLTGKHVIVFNLLSAGQVQFVQPIVEGLRAIKQPKLALYLAVDYPMPEAQRSLQIPLTHCFLSRLASRLPLIDLFLEAEIYGRGPKNALKVMIGHGQPNKISNWSDENLRAFDVYFLYGPLLREMFAFVQQDKPESTHHLRLMNVGYPKLDDQLNGRIDCNQVLANLKLNAGRRTVIYAPAWDPGCSLRTHGTEIVERLLADGTLNVLVKLHPGSVEPKSSPYYEFYTGGVDWAERFRNLQQRYENLRYIDEQVVNPYLVASDLMVTDFSGVALEFMMLDRPVVYFDCPEFYEKTLPLWKCDPELARNDDRFNAGRNYGQVVATLDEMMEAIRSALEDPKKGSTRRKELMTRLLYNPGRGTEASISAVLELLEERRQRRLKRCF